LQHAIRNVEGKQVGLKLNGTYGLLVYVCVVNPLVRSINTIKENTESLTDLVLR
jgi:hypothetical protein